MFPPSSSLFLMFMMSTVCSSSHMKPVVEFVPLIANQIAVQSLGYCEDYLCNSVKDYPAGYLQQKLSIISHHHGRGGRVLQAYEAPPLPEASISSNMCESNRHEMTPMAARNIAHQWKYVIQIKGHYEQKLEYDICKHDKECFAKNYLPYDYTTRCEQHRVVVPLLALDLNGTVAMDRFPVPAGCLCTFTRSFRK